MNNDMSKKLAVDFYRKMKFIRRFEEKVVELVNRNEIYGTTHEYVGQEAVAVSVCSALEQDDYIISTHRGHGHMIAKGGDIRYMFSELMGKASGYNRGKGGSMHISEPGIGILGANGIVGAGVPVAAGAALAIKMRNSSQIVAVFYGDGAVGFRNLARSGHKEQRKRRGNAGESALHQAAGSGKPRRAGEGRFAEVRGTNGCALGAQEEAFAGNEQWPD